MKSITVIAAKTKAAYSATLHFVARGGLKFSAFAGGGPTLKYTTVTNSNKSVGAEFSAWDLVPRDTVLTNAYALDSAIFFQPVTTGVVCTKSTKAPFKKDLSRTKYGIMQHIGFACIGGGGI